ncbi:tRNA (adenosine(37)-N6)-threonylcarbamoyltransferase complex ATPase subunit type 1 TsaE [Candidatus Pelagibacter sp.]|uniref:tRNA (adenosine(37)-N6)-threonylcarbamoyltransferase complex ATPase subunit type 1 TsaE n=1 Tax=Candidatus Pelagibacter sp. TaxID=2024849 RepID=UPI003F8683BE
MHIATNTSSGKINISSEKITAEIAKEFTNIFVNGDIVFLIGEMGVGKTTFVRYLINEFQKKNNLDLTEVTSPTFNILNEYQIEDINIKHYDLYRLKEFNEINNLGILEDTENSLILIEWPTLLLDNLNNFIKLSFSYSKDYQSRELSYENLIKNVS